MALKLLKGVISEDLHRLLKSQVILSSKQPKGRRYNSALKSWALSIYHTSGKAYTFLQKVFKLPSKRTLSRMVSRFASEAGFSKKSLYVIQERIKSLPAGANVCSLLMDEMSLKSHLFYSLSDDSIVGLEDYGNGKSSCLLATSALVVMVRGILYNWKQPVAYFLVNESCGTTQLHTILDEALLHLESLGLNVVSVVSDQGSNFLKLFASLGVSPYHPYFEMRGKQYFTIFDPPHLLKSIRNNLMKYDFEFEGKIACWQDIKLFYDKDQKLPIRVSPKITDKHINPNGFSKMKVKLAAQVFSHSVAAGLSTYVALHAMPGSALGTAQFVSKIDTIFDCCNSLSSRDPKFCRRPFSHSSPHMHEITTGIDFFESLKAINRQTGEDRTSYLKCLNGWIITLKAISLLWRKLYSEGIASFLITRQLNQDPLENFFGSIRQQGGNNDNPTPIQFQRAYKKLFHSNLLQVNTGNCEDDIDESLVKLANIKDTSPPDLTMTTNSLQLVTPDYRNEQFQNRMLAENAITYVSGYLLRKTFLKHTCNLCKSTLVDDDSYDDRRTLLSFKAYDSDSSYGGLIAPSNVMLQYTIQLEDTFIKHLRNLQKVTCVGRDLLQLLESIHLDQPCDSFNTKYLLMLFIRLRVYYCLKFANRELRTPGRKNKKYFKVAHL